MIKKCSQCKENKDISKFYSAGFYRFGKRKWRSECKLCRQYKRDNKYKEKVKKRARLFYYNKKNYGIDFEEARNKVLERDKNKCYLCGRKYRIDGNLLKLNVHHKDSNKKNNKLNNLITLCFSCHFLIEKLKIITKNLPLTDRTKIRILELLNF